MPDCLCWHHPAFALVGKRIGKLGVKGGAGLVFGVFTALRTDPVLSGEIELQQRIALLIEGLGLASLAVRLILAGLQQLGVVDQAGRALMRTETVRRNETVTKRFVTGRPPLGDRAMTGAQRSARWRARKALDFGPARYRSAAVDPPSVRDETRDETPSPAPSFSFFPQSPSREAQTQKPVREPGDETASFIELQALWPLSNRMADAEREYRKALRFVTPSALLKLARHYLDTKPEWRSTMFLANWLHTEPWRDPVLPLSAPLRAVDAADADPQPRKPDWVKRLEALRDSGVWPVDWGPRWGEPGCLAPGLETGLGQAFRRHFAHRQQQPELRAG